VVRRILALHYQPESGAGGPSWLSFLGHTKDSLWSLDFFRYESMMLRTHWVLVVMDHYTRRIFGFGIHAGVVNGEALCRMFRQAIRGVTTFPRCLSSDHDPLYRFHQWEANLRILGVREIKTVPYVPWSQPPTTLGSAPSIPATTITTRAFAIRSRRSSNRCKPEIQHPQERSDTVEARAVSDARRNSDHGNGVIKRR